MRHLVIAMGHIQTNPTPLRTDNSTATGFANKNMIMKQSKTWDMQLHWLRDPTHKQQFGVFWDNGRNNGADYHTKHHSTIHHRRVRLDRKYVRDIHNDFKHKINCMLLKQKVTKAHCCEGVFNSVTLVSRMN